MLPSPGAPASCRRVGAGMRAGETLAVPGFETGSAAQPSAPAARPPRLADRLPCLHRPLPWLHPRLPSFHKPFPHLHLRVSRLHGRLPRLHCPCLCLNFPFVGQQRWSVKPGKRAGEPCKWRGEPRKSSGKPPQWTVRTGASNLWAGTARGAAPNARSPPPIHPEKARKTPHPRKKFPWFL